MLKYGVQHGHGLESHLIGGYGCTPLPSCSLDPDKLNDDYYNAVYKSKTRTLDESMAHEDLGTVDISHRPYLRLGDSARWAAKV